MYIIFGLLYLVIEFGVFLNLEYTRRAMINTGVIAVLWNIDAAFLAIADLLLFKNNIIY